MILTKAPLVLSTLFSFSGNSDDNSPDVVFNFREFLFESDFDGGEIPEFREAVNTALPCDDGRIPCALFLDVFGFELNLNTVLYPSWCLRTSANARRVHIVMIMSIYTQI
jgi:hypothetical protein